MGKPVKSVYSAQNPLKASNFRRFLRKNETTQPLRSRGFLARRKGSSPRPFGSLPTHGPFRPNPAQNDNPRSTLKLLCFLYFHHAEDQSKRQAEFTLLSTFY